MSKTMISTRELSKIYGRGSKVVALDKLNLDVYEGETFGLLGPNGAGKTTTVRLLNCIIKPTGASATVGGHDLIDGSLEIRSGDAWVSAMTLTAQSSCAVSGSGSPNTECRPSARSRQTYGRTMVVTNPAVYRHPDYCSTERLRTSWNWV